MFYVKQCHCLLCFWFHFPLLHCAVFMYYFSPCYSQVAILHVYSYTLLIEGWLLPSLYCFIYLLLNHFAFLVVAVFHFDSICSNITETKVLDPFVHFNFVKFVFMFYLCFNDLGGFFCFLGFLRNPLVLPEISGKCVY